MLPLLDYRRQREDLEDAGKPLQLGNLFCGGPIDWSAPCDLANRSDGAGGWDRGEGMGVRSLGAGVRIGPVDGMSSAERIDAAELHRRYLKDVFQYVSRRVPPQEAEDITMQVFAA